MERGGEDAAENDYGQLGDRTTTDRNMPVQAVGLENIIAVGAGYDHSLSVKIDGTVYAWGRNDFGQLGDGRAFFKPVAFMVMLQVDYVSEKKRLQGIRDLL